LDASALLAFVLGEPGGDSVDLEGAGLSAVNWSEVLQKVYSRNVDSPGFREALTVMDLAILPFDAGQADAAAEIWAATRQHGLSLGDTACLALAQLHGVPAVTADIRWVDLQLGIPIQMIR
jgi:PIN domain nuclease of toxin-antitoxin system